MRQIRHGRELTAADVGPAPIGNQPLREVAGGVIRDGQSPPFLTAKPLSATYDGQHVAGPHDVIEGVRFTGPVSVSTRRPLVFRNVVFAPARQASACVATVPDAHAALFTHCRFEGPRNAHAQNGLMLRTAGTRVHRCHLTRVGDGIRIAARAIRITETLIDDLVTRPGDHNDALQVGNLGSDLTIARCRILNRHRQTSCLYLRGEKITADACYFAGGGWTVYGGADGNGKGQPDARDVRVTDCIFGRDYFARCGHFGPVTYWPPASTGSVFARNRLDDGRPVTVAR